MQKVQCYFQQSGKIMGLVSLSIVSRLHLYTEDNGFLSLSHLR